MQLFINRLRTKRNPLVSRLSSYRAVNIPSRLQKKTVNSVNGIKSPYLADIIKTRKYTLVQNVELLDVKTGGTKSNHWSLKG